jgi:ubiquitin carboxyl-terminal hydrolase 8
MEEGNSWNCPKCKQKRKAFKKMSIYKAPKILILFFKRFESEYDGRYHTMRKIETFVDFPHVLDLKNYVEK